MPDLKAILTDILTASVKGRVRRDFQPEELVFEVFDRLI